MPTDTGSIPSVIDHDESAALHIGRGDLPSALLSHLAADRERHGATMKQLATMDKHAFGQRRYAKGALAILAILGTAIVVGGPYIVRLAIQDVVTPQVSTQIETIRVSLDKFKESVDKRLEAR